MPPLVPSLTLPLAFYTSTAVASPARPPHTRTSATRVPVAVSLSQVPSLVDPTASHTQPHSLYHPAPSCQASPACHDYISAMRQHSGECCRSHLGNVDLHDVPDATMTPKQLRKFLSVFALFQDCYSFRTILLGIVASGISCFDIGSRKFPFYHPIISAPGA